MTRYATSVASCMLLLVLGVGINLGATAQARKIKPVALTIAKLAPRVHVRLDERRRPPAVVMLGRGNSLTFEQFFTDPAIFAGQELNDIKYQIGRGYWKPTAYNFFGLAQYRGNIHVGVNWYSPEASSDPSAHAVIFRLGWKTGRLTATPVRKLANHRDKYLISVPKTVLLDALEGPDPPLRRPTAK